MKKVINTLRAPQAIGPYSQAVLCDNTFYISGQIPLDPQTQEMEIADISKQTKRVLNNLKEILYSEGCDFSHLVKVSIFLKDFDHFKTVNEIYQSYFTSDSYPARETIEVSRLPKDALIEISAIAYK